MKSDVDFESMCDDIVALFARAWIEIVFGYKDGKFVKVALFARAWIEIA